MVREIKVSYEEMHKRYPEWYHAFKERAVKPKDIYLKTAQKILDFCPSLLNKEFLETLGIGVGYGHSDIPILKNLLDLLSIPIFFDYLDISQPHLECFKENIEGEGIEDILRNSFITRWEDFNEERSYDFVLSSHAWYGIHKPKLKDNLAHVHKILYYLKKRGIAAVLLGRYDTTRFFSKKFNAETKYWFVAEDFIGILKKLGVREIQETRFSFRLNISDAINFKREGASCRINEEGKMLISYCLGTVYDSMSEEKKRAINNYLLEHGFWDENKFYLEGGESLILFGKGN